MENILAPIDFSKGSLNSARYAANLARFFSAKLILYHVYHLPLNNFETGYISPMEDSKSEVKAELEKYTAQLLKDFEGIEIQSHLDMGFASDQILSAAKRYHADLIVMGISGQNKFIKEHIIGSTSAKVAQTSKIPVMIVPEHVNYSKIHKIAYACDLDQSLEENTTLVRVKYFCALFDAELEILNVRKPSQEMSVEEADTDRYVEDKFKTTRHHSFFIYENKVDRGLIEFLDHEKTDLIISSPKSHGFFHNLFIESNTSKLIFHSPVPILTVHE